MGAAVWYGAVTRSTANVDNFTKSLRSEGFDLLPNRSSNLLSTLLLGNVNSTISPSTYQTRVAQQYDSSKPFVHPLPQASSDRWTLQPLPAKSDPVGVRALRLLIDKTHLFLNQLVNLLAVIGAVALAFGRRRSTMRRQIGLLGISTLLFLGFVRLSGTAAAAYNQERALIQALIPLSVAVVACLVVAAHGLQRKTHAVQQGSARARWVTAGTVMGLTVLLITSTGLRTLGSTTFITGNLGNGGEDAKRFIATRGEVAGSSWLYARTRLTGQLVYTDQYGQLRWLLATGDVSALELDVTPRTLDKEAWVFSDAANTNQGEARGRVGNSLSLYRYPTAYLTTFYDTVYANGDAVVYHGSTP
jgi:hypothetical protein